MKLQSLIDSLDSLFPVLKASLLDELNILDELIDQEHIKKIERDSDYE